MEYLLWIWDFIGDNVAAIIASCALGVAVWQGCVTRKHNRLQVKPFLVSKKDKNAAERSLKLRVVNNGIGPAVIKEFGVTIDGKPKEDGEFYSVEETEKALLGDYAGQYDSSKGDFSVDYVMSAKEEKVIFYIVLKQKSKATLVEIESILNRADLEIKYESVYGDRFNFSTQ